MDMELYVQDVVTRTRRVRIGDKCPECGADLREPNAIMCQQFSASMQYMTVPEDGDIDWGGIKSAEGDITIGYSCANCDHWLITSQEVGLDFDESDEAWEVKNALEMTFDLLLKLDKDARAWLDKLKELKGEDDGSRSVPGGDT